MSESRPSVRIQPGTMAGMVYRTQFQELTAALSERLEAELDPPEGAASPGTGVTPLDFALHLAGDVAPYVLPFIIEKIGETLVRDSRHRKVPVTGVIHGPNGEIIHKFKRTIDP